MGFIDDKDQGFIFYMMIIIICFMLMIISGCVWKLFKDKEFKKTILHRNVPNLLTSLGVFGTFLGVYQALQNFDDANLPAYVVNTYGISFLARVF